MLMVSTPPRPVSSYRYHPIPISLPTLGGCLYLRRRGMAWRGAVRLLTGKGRGCGGEASKAPEGSELGSRRSGGGGRGSVVWKWRVAGRVGGGDDLLLRLWSRGVKALPTPWRWGGLERLAELSRHPLPPVAPGCCRGRRGAGAHGGGRRRGLRLVGDDREATGDDRPEAKDQPALAGYPRLVVEAHAGQALDALALASDALRISRGGEDLAGQCGERDMAGGAG